VSVRASLVRVARRSIVGAALVAGAVAPARAQAQQVAARFEITSVGDSTFTFAIGSQAWVARRNRGIVVDPARRDALVARFRILVVTEGVVTALVTGQTTPVTTQHFVVMNPPPPPRWHHRGTFWAGTALGGVVGLILGGVIF
jgi:hypothetical protein